MGRRASVRRAGIGRDRGGRTSSERLGHTVFRNTRLVAGHPESLEDLAEQAEQLQRSGAVPYGITFSIGHDGEPFFMYPFLAGAGGDTFLRDGSGRVRQEFSNVESRGMVAAFDYFRLLGRAGRNILYAAPDGFEAIKTFVSGQAPYLVSCAFALADVRRSGIAYEIGPIPRARRSGSGPPLVSVESFFLTRRGAENPIAQDWIECYLTRRDVAEAHFRSQPRPLALKAQLSESLTQDADIRTVFDVWENGDLMPSGPQMADYWRHLRTAEVELLSGTSSILVAKRLSRGLACGPAA